MSNHNDNINGTDTMFIKYYTREGHFNYSDTNQVSFRCHLDICDEDANVIKYCNFRPEYELNGSNVDEIIAEITESLDRYWTTPDDRKEIVAFLEKNRSRIIEGNTKRRLAEIETELAALEEEKERLSTV